MSATRTDATFRLAYRVTTTIDAAPEQIWALLTDAPGFPAWNSTVQEVGGRIALGEALAIKVPIAPGRTFTPKVTAFEPARRMVWADGMAPMFRGERTFTLEPLPGGGTTFTMEEVFTGIMLPMIKGSLPDFRAPFTQYAADLKAAAERRAA
jgi:hypothetical protein